MIHDSRESAINRYLMDQANGPDKSFFVNMNRTNGVSIARRSILHSTQQQGLEQHGMRVPPFSYVGDGICWLFAFLVHPSAVSSRESTRDSVPHSGYKHFDSFTVELHYLHTHHVIHRDLKPSNILVDAQTKQIKLCDFGCSKRITGNVEAHKSTPLVTSRFYRYALLLRVTSRAPELLMGATHYSFAIDIWSLGCGMDTSFPHHIQSSPKCSLDIPSLYR